MFYRYPTTHNFAMNPVNSHFEKQFSHRQLIPSPYPFHYYQEQYPSGYIKPNPTNFYQPLVTSSQINPYPMNYQPIYPTPYPSSNQMQQKPQGMQMVMSQFKKQDGSFDLNKMIDTAGQVMGAVNQIGSLVKGLSSTFKV